MIDNYSGCVLPLVYGDEVKLREVLMNLMSNACDFCMKGHITLAAKIQDGMVLFSVSDTGPGISVDLCETLFDRFKQVRSVTRRHGGSGLGLSICKLLVNLHGGQIWFETELNIGTTFFFTIPAASLAQVASSVSEEAGTSIVYFDPIAQKLPLQAIILNASVVELQYMESLLSRHGYELFELNAETLDRAMEFVVTLEPDLVIIVRDRSGSRLNWIQVLQNYLPSDGVLIETDSSMSDSLHTFLYNREQKHE